MVKSGTGSKRSAMSSTTDKGIDERIGWHLNGNVFQIDVTRE